MVMNHNSACFNIPIKIRYIVAKRPVNHAFLIGDLPVRIFAVAFISLDYESIGVTSL